MAAPEGNQFWKLRASSGPKLKYESDEQLLLDCQEYFETRSQMTMNGQPLPYTIGSLCIFLDISHDTWITWRKERKDLSEVIKHVEMIIDDQKLTGAMVGSYNHNIVSRLLGLVDKKSHEGEVTVNKIERRIVKPDG